MSTFTQILYQIVFRGKSPMFFLTTDNEDALYVYIAGILKAKNCHSYIVGGYGNHIHIITHIHPSVAPASMIKDIKMATTSMMKGNTLFSHFRGWQTGYGLFTYHISARKNLISYVENQYEHHTKTSYLDEFIRLLKEHKIEYKEQYLLT